MAESPILAADTSLSREVLQGYKNCQFYGIQEAEKLAEEMAYEVDMNKEQILNNGGGRITTLIVIIPKSLFFKTALYFP